jgi:hypothetical protein
MLGLLARRCEILLLDQLPHAAYNLSVKKHRRSSFLQPPLVVFLVHVVFVVPKRPASSPTCIARGSLPLSNISSRICFPQAFAMLTGGRRVEGPRETRPGRDPEDQRDTDRQSIQKTWAKRGLYQPRSIASPMRRQARGSRRQVRGRASRFGCSLRRPEQRRRDQLTIPMLSRS